MDERHFILATAGHVDHGKSSLVLALTGTDPDRLPEEKARGITIDLGFAHLRLGVGPSLCSLGIIDVPGHEDFVKNMVAGVGSIDIAMLVVAADDGWMPQTEEHLQILEYLGVARGVVALSKADLCADVPAAIEAVRARLAGMLLEAAPIVPTCAANPDTLEPLKTALEAQLAEAPVSRDVGKPRLPIDRVFTLRGIGTVLTGTLAGGSLSQGQAVLLQPHLTTGKVRSIQNHNRELSCAVPGMRVAVSIPEFGSGSEGPGAQRGDVVTVAPLGQPSNWADVEIRRSARLAAGGVLRARPLRDRTRVRIHFGSGNAPALLVLPAGTGTLDPGGRCLARLHFERPVFWLGGDRFIVRDWAEQATLAGGMVLDPGSSGARIRFSEVLRSGTLAERAKGFDAATWVRGEMERQCVVAPNELLRQSRFGLDEIHAAVADALAKGSLKERQAVLICTAWLERMVKAAADILDNYHRLHPERPGMPIQEFRSLLEPQLPGAQWMGTVLEEIQSRSSQFQISGQWIKTAAHRLSLPGNLQAAGNRIRAVLTAKAMEPPSLKELTADKSGQLALRFLVENGEAVMLGEEVALLSSHYRNASDLVRSCLMKKGEATASELREVLGTTRRIVIPLLERLDRERLTMRIGDKRRWIGANRS